MPDAEVIPFVDDEKDVLAAFQPWRRQHLDERRAGRPGSSHILRFSHRSATAALYATRDYRLVA